MSLSIFMFLLLVIASLTGLFTEAVKKQLSEYSKSYHSNMLAGMISICIGIFICVGYIIYSGLSITPTLIVSCIALIILGWLSAMVGYDKVVQTISQVKGGASNDDN
ncbi:hypothetical protein SDC9_148484 [bioreactor metagenome]|uniref:Uncharacterized protein n=1 Tax=bioreactor metagenome TaxID=1076179 RepID=A0A645EGZ6_9ZZZZ|nr:aminopeptidase [Candidatus Metalachnospira sp.]